MSDRLDFVQAIQAEPDDDVARLVFADYLEDQSDPQAELIRVQLQLTEEAGQPPSRSHDRLRQREQELLDHFRQLWCQPLRELGATGVYIRRGFVDELRIHAEKFVAHAAQILELAPALRLLNLRRAASWVSSILETPELHRIRHLDLRLASLSHGDVRNIVAAPALKKLTGLNLHGNNIGNRGLRTLARYGVFQSLQNLHYGGNRVGDDGIAALTQSPVLSQLRSLVLWGNDVSPAGLRALAAWEGLKNLQVLDLSYPARPINMHVLQESEYWNPDCRLV